MTKFNAFTSTASRFYADESGATAIEYAMIASGVGAFVGGAVYSLGGKVKGLFTSLSGLFGS